MSSVHCPLMQLWCNAATGFLGKWTSVHFQTASCCRWLNPPEHGIIEMHSCVCVWLFLCWEMLWVDLVVSLLVWKFVVLCPLVGMPCFMFCSIWQPCCVVRKKTVSFIFWQAYVLKDTDQTASVPTRRFSVSKFFDGVKCRWRCAHCPILQCTIRSI